MYDVKKIRETVDISNLKYYLSAMGGHALSAAGGFFGSLAVIEGLSPFGAAFAAAVFPEFVPAAVIGSVLGYFTMYGFSVLTLRYIAASCIAGIISCILKRNPKPQYFRHFSALAGFFSVFVTGLVLCFAVSFSISEIVMYSAEGAMAGACAFFIDRCININPIKKYAARLSDSETAAVLVVLSVTLLSLKHFDFSVFSPAVILGVYVVLAASSFGGEKYGALTGICAGAVLGFAGDEPFITGGVALGGLLCGIFGKKSRFISAIIFIITTGIAAFSSSDWKIAANIVYDVGIAAVLFILTPGKIRKFIERIFSLSDDGMFLEGQRKVLETRFDSASDGMERVASSVKAVAGIYRRRTIPKSDDIYMNVCNDVCVKCGKYDACWNRNYGKTYDYFRQITSAYRRSDSPGENDFPYRFFTECREPDKITASLSAELGRYRAAMRETAKTGDTVNIVSDQYAAISSFLGNFALMMGKREEYLPEYSELVRNILENDFSADIISCGSFRNEFGKIYIEIRFGLQREKYDCEEIALSIGELLDKNFEKAVVRSLSDGTMCMCMCEKTKYEVISGSYQINSKGGYWCGDTTDSFFDGKGHYIMILSDGMGTGKRAAADSVLCCSLASVMLKSGFSEDCILKMINSAMIVRSGEESIATLDIADINLYDGSVKFYKAGAGFSAVMRHQKMLKAESPSLPVGILRDIDFETIEINLGADDCVALMSDGVSENAMSMWKEIMKSATEYDGDELADKLAKTAVLNSEKDNPDDITVLTATLLLNERI